MLWVVNADYIYLQQYIINMNIDNPKGYHMQDKIKERISKYIETNLSPNISKYLSDLTVDLRENGIRLIFTYKDRTTTANIRWRVGEGNMDGVYQYVTNSLMVANIIHNHPPSLLTDDFIGLFNESNMFVMDLLQWFEESKYDTVGHLKSIASVLTSPYIVNRITSEVSGGDVLEVTYNNKLYTLYSDDVCLDTEDIEDLPLERQLAASVMRRFMGPVHDKVDLSDIDRLAKDMFDDHIMRIEYINNLSIDQITH